MKLIIVEQKISILHNNSIVSDPDALNVDINVGEVVQLMKGKKEQRIKAW